MAFADIGFELTILLRERRGIDRSTREFHPSRCWPGHITGSRHFEKEMENVKAKLSLSTELGKLLGGRGRGSPLSTDFRDNLHGAEVQTRILTCTPGVPELGTLPPGARPKVSDPMTKTPVDSDKTESSVLSLAGSPRKSRDSPVVKGGDTLHNATGDENSPGPRLSLVERDLSIFSKQVSWF